MNIFPAGEVLENVTTRGIQLDFRLGKKVEKHHFGCGWGTEGRKNAKNPRFR